MCTVLVNLIENTCFVSKFLNKPTNSYWYYPFEPLSELWRPRGTHSARALLLMIRYYFDPRESVVNSDNYRKIIPSYHRHKIKAMGASLIPWGVSPHSPCETNDFQSFCIPWVGKSKSHRNACRKVLQTYRRVLIFGGLAKYVCPNLSRILFEKILFLCDFTVYSIRSPLTKKCSKVMC